MSSIANPPRRLRLVVYAFFRVHMLLPIRLKLRALHRFTSTATAVEDITAIQDGKLPKALKKFLSNEVVGKGKGKETLVVTEPKLGALLSTFTDAHLTFGVTQRGQFQKNSGSMSLLMVIHWTSIVEYEDN